MPTATPTTPPPLTVADRVALMVQYRAGYGTLVEALRGMTPEELDWRPEPDAWCIREVVHHLEDAEMTGAVRLRRLLTEEDPWLPVFDEEVYARRLHYAARPIESALRAIEAAHATTAELLEAMSEADWQRAGTHSTEGPYPMTRWLAFHAAHPRDHAAQIREIRARWAARRR